MYETRKIRQREGGSNQIGQELTDYAWFWNVQSHKDK